MRSAPSSPPAVRLNTLEERGIEQCRNVSLREKLLTRLLGRREKVMILVPGNSVESVCITEVPEGGAACE